MPSKKLIFQSGVPVKALCIGQPWAELILRRRKPFEIRSWRTNYRGLLLIHASKRFHIQSAEHLGVANDNLTTGAFVGWSTLADVRPFTKNDARLLKKKKGDDGWWAPNQFAWVLKGVHRIEPIPFKGRLGLFTPPTAILRRIKKVRSS